MSSGTPIASIKQIGSSIPDAPSNGKYYARINNTWVEIFVNESVDFLTLIDTPEEYSNSEGLILAVNSLGTGVEFRKIDVGELEGGVDIQSLSEKNMANGYAGLDESGKLILSLVPTSLQYYKGSYSSLDDLTLKYPSGEDGWFAFIISMKNLYFWDTSSLSWTSLIGGDAVILASQAQEVAESSASVAEEALDMAKNFSHSHLNKDILDEIGEAETEAPSYKGKELALADGSNGSAEGYRELVGIPEVEADVAGIIAKQERILTGIAPQTIVQGNIGSIPAGWAESWCDAPALHLVQTGDQEVTIKAGLQVVGGYKGRAILSKVLESDHSIDLSFATGAYSFAIYTDINEYGDFTLFGEWNTSLHPLYVSNIYKDYSGTAPAMWYNPAECTSRYFTAEGVAAEICRVFIGEVYTDASGNIAEVNNYQHGTSCIVPINDGNLLGLNAWYFSRKSYQYLCLARAEIFAERWNQTNWIYNGSLNASYGTVAMTVPSSSTVWVRTGSVELGSIPPAAPSMMPYGNITEGFGRLVMKRAW